MKYVFMQPDTKVIVIIIFICVKRSSRVFSSPIGQKKGYKYNTWQTSNTKPETYKYENHRNLNNEGWNVI